MLLISALLSWGVGRRQGEGYEVRLREFPMTVGSWQGRDVTLAKLDTVYAVLETTAVLSRLYENRNATGEAVDLLVTYFERGQRGFHPPEVSFVASGNTVIKSGIVRIPLSDDQNAPQLEANMFVGRTRDGEVLFLYWFGIGERVMANYYKGSVYLLWNAIVQRPSPASMVRIALPMLDGDLSKTLATAGGFVRQIVPVLPEYLTERPRTGPPTRT